MENKLIIAIDGYSSSGKSTLAKQIAKALGFIFVDSGAMYRAVTYYLQVHKIDINNREEVINALPNIQIEFKNKEGKNTCFLNGKNVEKQIRTIEVSRLVSEVSAISEVRSFLVAQQRKYGQKGNLVMDGRDIGTVVFPDADIKFFIKAELKTRAGRRYKELQSKDQDVQLDEVLSNISHRDHTDTTRADSPLKKADDAIEIDNTHLNQAQQFELAMNHIMSVHKFNDSEE
ncbi:MAG: (d)CMP kinase [Saprospiraceae bacterium]|nr:(d)CMP kinase [Saprospiraceae bacterium]